jgi:pimeloyl-ACP methyl ester carboxylesterase
MNASTVADVLLIGAAVVWVLARQVQRAWVKPRLLVLAPLVLAFFGIRSLPASTWQVPADLALLAVSAALSLGLGVWRGQTIKVWRDADGTWWRQGSVLTLVLWRVLIVARGLLYGVGVTVGHREASGLEAVLVMLALNLHAATTVDFRNDTRAPLLLIAGGKDQVAPASVTEANFKLYRESSAVTDFKKFPDRSYFTIGEAGWEQVADYALDWAVAHSLKPAA